MPAPRPDLTPIPTAREDLLAPVMGVRTLMVAPRHVVTGAGALDRLGERVAALGKRALVVTGTRSWCAAEAPVREALAAAGVAVEATSYGQDCCEPELDRMIALVRTTHVDVVVGVGGGKALDAAKLVAHRAGLGVVTVPTSAATCAAMTALSNVYSPSGAWLYGVTLDAAPDAVVIDPALVATAPARLLASGMGDAMAKWVESSASVEVEAADAMTFAAVELARALYERLRWVGEAAYREAEDERPDEAFTQAVDACIQLAGTVGGLGGSRCRSVVAHAVANALTARPGQEASWHGEKVAYGILVQRVLQGFRPETLVELVRFFRALGLPTTLAALGVASDAQSRRAIAELVAHPASSAHLLPGGVDARRVEAALSQADAIGRNAVPIAI